METGVDTETDVESEVESESESEVEVEVEVAGLDVEAEVVSKPFWCRTVASRRVL